VITIHLLERPQESEKLERKAFTLSGSLHCFLLLHVKRMKIWSLSIWWKDLKRLKRYKEKDAHYSFLAFYTVASTSYVKLPKSSIFPPQIQPPEHVAHWNEWNDEGKKYATCIKRKTSLSNVWKAFFWFLTFRETWKCDSEAPLPMLQGLLGWDPRPRVISE
jgi:hypothetical protein